MCLAVPSKVIKIENDWAIVQSRPHGGQAGDHQHRANLNLLKNVKVGDYLIIHDELAINKLTGTEAKKIIKMIETHSCHQ